MAELISMSVNRKPIQILVNPSNNKISHDSRVNGELTHVTWFT